jgi:AcrR family transcriptional regulator
MRYHWVMSRAGGDVDLASARAMTRSSADPRAARTRRAILDAVGQLTAAGATTICVSDVVRQAGVSRSSFYAHFSSLDDLAAGFLREEFNAIAAAGIDLRREGRVSGVEAAHIGYRRLVAHLIANDSSYGSVLGLPVSRRAYDEALRAYAEEMLQTIVELSYVPAGVVPEIAAMYMAGGSLMLISSWIRGNLKIRDDELVGQLVALLPSWLDG